MKLQHSLLRAMVGLGLVGLCVPAGAADWPRFRGPNGTGVSSDPVPVKFSAKENVVWKVAIPGSGFSSPVISNGRIFLQSASPDGKERWLVCLNVADGKLLWKQAAPGASAKIHKKNSLASSTPAADGKSVYTVFWDGSEVTAAAYDYSGKRLWTAGLGGFTSQHGAGESPVVHGGRVFINHDQDGASRLVALDASTGKLAWQKERKAYRACYSTPFVLQQADATDLVVASTAGVTGYDPATGNENWNWTWDWAGSRAPLRTVASPVYADGLVFVAAGDGAGDRAMVAVKTDGKGDISKTGKVWENRKSFPYVPSLLVNGPHIYFINDKGIAACHDIKTGNNVWTKRVDGNVSSSPILVNGNIYACTEEGDVHVFAAKPEFELLSTNTLGEQILATPAAADGRLYIRTAKNLYCIGKK